MGHDEGLRLWQLTESNEVLRRQVNAQATELANAAQSRENYRARIDTAEKERDSSRQEVQSLREVYMLQTARMAELTAEVETLRAQERLMGERDRGTGRLLSEAYRRGWGDGSEAARKALREMAASFTLPVPGDRPQHACTCIRTPQLPDHRPSNAACNLTRYHRAMEGRAMA